MDVVPSDVWLVLL